MHIDITNEQSRVPVDERRLRAAIAAVVETEAGRRGAISLAVVDDATIQELNRRYLDHDYPTDVLSFVFDRGSEVIDGEIIVSGDTAAESSERFGWSAEDELLLYVIHGALHLVGYDDESPGDAAHMRKQEARYLALFGRGPHQHATTTAEPEAFHPSRQQVLSEGIQP